jgi:hypothetical protein
MSNYVEQLTKEMAIIFSISWNVEKPTSNKLVISMGELNIEKDFLL